MSPGNFRASQSNTNLVILLKHKILHLVSYKYMYYSPADNNCDANDEDIEAENTEHNDDKQEGEVDSSKGEFFRIAFDRSCNHDISHWDNRRIYKKKMTV